MAHVEPTATDRGYAWSMAAEDLTPRERRVLGLIDGTFDGHRRTVEQVAIRFGVTPQRIEEILEAARRKLDD
jgi:DNA-directed RNA polymerase sigma subunit (sigma70/sigma32)